MADHDVHADRAEVRNDAHHDIQLVRRAFGCFPLARQCAPRAEAGVEALHGVHEAPAERRSPVPRHSFLLRNDFRAVEKLEVRGIPVGRREVRVWVGVAKRRVGIMSGVERACAGKNKKTGVTMRPFHATL